MAIARLHSVVINAADPDRLVDFWRAVLDVEEAQRLPGFVWLRRQREGAPSLMIQHVEDPTPGRRRLHLDFGVDNIAEARYRIEQLGGSYVEDHEIHGFAWTVMADPEGNEFCIAAA